MQLRINGGNGWYTADYAVTREQIEVAIARMAPGDNVCVNHVTNRVYPSSMTPGNADTALANWYHGDRATRRHFEYVS